MLFKNTLVFFMFVLLSQLTTGQNWVMIRGGIFDIQGKALPGANIKNKGRFYGTLRIEMANTVSLWPLPTPWK